jgi:large subunit ribosomal protein L15
MRLEDLKPDTGSRKRNKRVGRGIGSGHGKTSCKGHKGQKARSGGTIGPAFEGGQMPLQRRLPKRGFKNRFSLEFAIINLKDINALKGIDLVTVDVLLEKGVIKNLKCGLKVLGEGELQRPVTIQADAFSASALAKIAAAGGKAEVV